MEHVDTLILGAGAAGLFCAGSLVEVAKHIEPSRILVIDHARSPGEKIRISGGGRCNFTNLATSRERFLSQNTRFCASALAGFTAAEKKQLIVDNPRTALVPPTKVALVRRASALA